MSRSTWRVTTVNWMTRTTVCSFPKILGRGGCRVSRSSPGAGTIDGLAGNDTISLAGTSAGFSGTLFVHGNEPNDADRLIVNGVAAKVTVDAAARTIVGAGPALVDYATIEVTGIGFITYAGVNADDALIVDPGSGDNAVRVERGTNGDWVVSDSLPRIEFTGLKTFQVDVGDAAAADVVTFATGALGDALPTNYELAGGTTDTLVIEGVDGAADLYTVTNPADTTTVTPSVAVSDRTVTETAGTLGRLQVNTLGGDDQLDVDNSTGLITLPSGIGFDGGLGSDLLRLVGSTAVTGSTYNVGPQADAGSVVHRAATDTNYYLRVHGGRVCRGRGVVEGRRLLPRVAGADRSDGNQPAGRSGAAGRRLRRRVADVHLGRRLYGSSGCRRSAADLPPGHGLGQAGLLRAAAGRWLHADRV